MRVAPPIDLTAEQQEALEQCARARSLSVRLVQRARIVLLAAAGKQDKDIAAELGITAQKAARWRKRFLALGMAGLERDAPRPGRAPSISAAKVKRVIQKTTQEKLTIGPIGPPGRWRRRSASASPQCGASGTTTGSSLIWWRRLKCPTIRTSPKSWKPSSAFTSIHPSMPWCCVAMRKVRFKLSTARSRACR